MRAPPGRRVAIVGAGPAGLMAAEILAASGHVVTIYERMPSPARKFLMAGRGGLNLTHSEPLDQLLKRYGHADGVVGAAVRAYPPSAVMAWCHALGQATFQGTSGRIFPKTLKASPLLRAWLRRLDGLGVTLERGMTWTGWDQSGALVLKDTAGLPRHVAADATLLALGGASWPRLGSDGSWVPVLEAEGVGVSPLTASNAGVVIDWSEIFRARFAGAPLKRIALSVGGARVRGEALVTRTGLEGGAVYALSPAIRDGVVETAGGGIPLNVDLRPDLDVADIARRLERPRGKQSATSFLRKSLSLAPVDIGLLREGAGKALPSDPETLARLVKAVPLSATALAGLERAISTAGGVHQAELDERLMLTAKPGVFVAGEMIDWDAPTGGYLLQATLATAVVAARGIDHWLSDVTAAGLARDPVAGI